MYTVLVITAHPDDMEIACAGTLLKCKERGDRVVVCHLSSGNQGHEIIMPDELTEMRAKEAQRSGALGGFEVMWGGFHDLEIYDNNRESRDKVVDVIKKVDPDFIITHDPEDYMPDHTATSRLVFDACFTATLPHYETKVAGKARLTPIYYMDTLAGVNFNPPNTWMCPTTSTKSWRCSTVTSPRSFGCGITTASISPTWSRPAAVTAASSAVLTTPRDSSNAGSI